MTFGIVASSHPLAALGYSGEVLADSPLLYLRLGESSGTTATDSSGNGRHGTHNADTGLGATGAISGDSDTCRTFVQGRYTAVSEDTWMQVTTVTVEAWVKSSSSAGGNTVVARYDNNNTFDRAFILDTSGGATRFIVWAGNANRIATNGSTTDNDGSWHHIVGTYDGATVRVYRDGTQVGSTSYSGTMQANVHDLGIIVGTREDNSIYHTAAQWFPGEIDEVAVYSGALSSTRIQAHYNAA